jgi:hypothetical protein
MSLVQSVLNFVPQLAGLAPATVALIGALVITMTALQGAALAAQALATLASNVFRPVPGLSAFFASCASACGVAALDLQKLGAVLSKGAAFLGRFVKPASDVAKKGIVWIVLIVFACAGCSAPFVFSSPSVQAVTCEITAAVLPLLEEAAASLGVPLAVVESLYATACAEAAAKGMSQKDAEAYGVALAKQRGLEMRDAARACGGSGK